MSDETKTPAATPVPVETLEQRLVKRHAENIKQLNERKKQFLDQRAQLDAAITQADDQIKVLSGAIAGLNELLETRRQEEAAATAAAPKAPEVPNGETVS